MITCNHVSSILGFCDLAWLRGELVTQVPKTRANATGRHMFTLRQTKNRTRKIQEVFS